MAIKRSSGKKASGGKAKKASPGKSPVKKTAKKAAAKKPAKKAVSIKKAIKKQDTRHAKPKLGFDPLSHEDIEALTAPGLTGVPLRDEDHHTGIDALIRDTSHESSPGAMSDTRRPEPLPREQEAAEAPEPEDHEEAAQESPVQEEPSAPAMPGSQEGYSGTDIDLGDIAEPEPETTEVAGTFEEAETGEPEAPVVTEASAPEESPEPVEAVKKPEPSGTTVARSGEQDEEQAGLLTFFSFRLGKESFAIPIERVREVLEHQEPTKVPRTPAHMLGVINLRGGVVPVVGLRVFFSMPEVELTVNSAVIIIEVNNDEEQSIVGILADSVREVMDIRDADIAPPPRIGTGLNTDYISGMGRFGDEFLMILDIDRAFSREGLL